MFGNCHGERLAAAAPASASPVVLAAVGGCAVGGCAVGVCAGTGAGVAAVAAADMAGLKPVGSCHSGPVAAAACKLVRLNHWMQAAAPIRHGPCRLLCVQPTCCSEGIRCQPAESHEATLQAAMRKLDSVSLYCIGPAAHSLWTVCFATVVHHQVHHQVHEHADGYEAHARLLRMAVDVARDRSIEKGMQQQQRDQSLQPRSLAIVAWPVARRRRVSAW
eukprot:358752-Chlamydomonas_euryale.AAC.8